MSGLTALSLGSLALQYKGQVFTFCEASALPASCSSPSNRRRRAGEAFYRNVTQNTACVKLHSGDNPLMALEPVFVLLKGWEVMLHRRPCASGTEFTTRLDLSSRIFSSVRHVRHQGQLTVTKSHRSQPPNLTHELLGARLALDRHKNTSGLRYVWVCHSEVNWVEL